MKRFLVLGGIIILGTIAVCSVYLGITSFSTPGSASEISNVDLYDVDAMAARMVSDKDYYSKVRDEALSAYASQHSVSMPYDEEAKTSIKLAAYYLTWGDFYGERVLLDLADIEEAAENKGCRDPMLCNLQTDGWDNTHFPNTAPRAMEICNQMTSAANGSYPAAFKFWGYQTAIISILEYNADANTVHSNTASMGKLPELVSLWQQSLSELLTEKAPDHIIYDMPMQLLEGCQKDEATMNLVIAAIDQDFNEAGVNSGGRLALDGDYFANMAWAARGSGYANTVSDSQFQIFGQRLQQAQQLLETAYSKYPNDPRIPVLMMQVALGGGIDRDAMETWFQRGVKADPNDFEVYSAKGWYLQPRWLGTVDDELKFTQECVATQNWSSKIPMVIARELDSVADNGEADIFERADVWQVVDATYRKYLELYPRASRYRTFFLRAAYLGKHLDVMKEQYKILGKNRDSQILSDDEYKDISANVGP